MSTQKRTIAVVGATGAQGGSLVRAALADPEGRFNVRALTRDPDSDKAKALAALGAEVVHADTDDEHSIKKAFAGAQSAFCVTNFWEHYSPERELQQAANMAEAAFYADVEHVIWSTLEDTRLSIPLDDDRLPTLQERYKVPHFDAKGEANAEFSERDVPTTFLYTSFYWDNLVHFGMGPKRNAEGTLELVLPMADKPLSGIAAVDIGKCAFGIFKAGSKYINESVSIAGEHLTGDEMAADLTEALGESVRYVPIDFDVYRGLGFPGADDLGNMFEYYVLCNREFCARRDLDRTRKLNPELLSFRDWLAQNAAQIQV